MPGEPVVTVLAFLGLLGLVVVLGRSSTARYEAERAQAQAPQQQSEVAVTHPAGRRTRQRAGWWLADGQAEDRSGARVLAGPFPDRIAADWAALSGALPASAHAVYGVRQADGVLGRRQSPQERAWLAELGGQLDRLSTDWDERLTDTDELTTLLVEVSAALVEAGLALYDCAEDSAAGGVCLIPEPGGGGILVTWRQHDRMSVDHVHGAALETAVQRTMNAAVADVLAQMGFPVTPVGTSGCHLVASEQSASTS
ncbi:hypothetical protein E4P41_07995 [Geodermatophilus sp. DF01-2]|uniref:hypothetical protein n=1 Tax=Geodermatophilus sp. DF01-2 TaxID=2559610 RepID=UPI0010738064|nr:hypothetical protein [Geodermatophilus sp. DF01_2]TFV62181.1 hypothetical protein E4P41_07995 [Geodermatophilus sp. DF01_2]